MPCYKCSNGKYKYGKRGNCQFDSLAHCRQAEQAIHAREGQKYVKKSSFFEEPCDDCKNEVENHYHKPYND